MFGKVGIDQLMYTPIATGIFYATLDTLEGHPETLPQTLKVRSHHPCSGIRTPLPMVVYEDCVARLRTLRDLPSAI